MLLVNKRGEQPDLLVHMSESKENLFDDVGEHGGFRGLLLAKGHLPYQVSKQAIFEYKDAGASVVLNMQQLDNVVMPCPLKSPLLQLHFAHQLVGERFLVIDLW